MTKKNAWNKVYEETEKTYKVKGKEVVKTVVGLAKPGMKPNKKEIEFGKAIKKMNTNKPKAFNGDWTAK